MHSPRMLSNDLWCIPRLLPRVALAVVVAVALMLEGDDGDINIRFNEGMRCGITAFFR